MTKLYLIDYQKYIDLGDFPIIINYSIANINNPSSRNLEFSNQFVVPGTKGNNQTFEHIYDIAHNVINFNPNKNIRCVIYNDDIQILRGYMRYDKSTTEDLLNSNNVNYYFTIFGERINFYDNLNFLTGSTSEKRIKDLNALQSLSHTYNESSIINSWGGSLNYLYPLINYGTSNVNSLMGKFININKELEVADFKPALKTKYVFDKIFEEAGYTYTSTFLNSDLFTRLWLPYDKKEMIFENQTPDFFVGLDTSGVTIQQITHLVYPNVKDFIIIPEGYTLLPFNKEAGVLTGLPLNEDPNLYDNFNRFNTTTFKYKSDFSGDYSFYYQINFSLEFLDELGNPLLVPLFDQVRVNLSLYCRDLNIRIQLAEDLLEDGDPPIPNKEYQIAGTSKVILQKDAEYNLELSVIADTRIGAMVVPKIQTILKMNESVWGSNDSENFRKNQYFKIGNTINFNKLNGFTMTQRSFIQSITNMFNLYYELEPNTNNFIIEPRDEYYLDEEVEWTYKIDNNIEQQIIYNNDVLLTYDKDNDLLNNRYEQIYDEIYGQYSESIDSDIKERRFEVKTNFAPTLFEKANTDDSFIISAIYSDSKEPIDHKQRILIYDNLIPSTKLTFRFSGTTHTSYPRLLHVDKFSGTDGVDLNYFYSKPFYSNIFGNQIGLPNQNLYNLFWKNTVEEVVGENSRLMRGKVYLTPQEISDLSFRKKYRIKDNLYRLNSLQINVTDNSLAEYELIRINQQATANFSGGTTTVETTDPGLIVVQNPRNPNNVVDGFGTQITGIGNIVAGKNIGIFGDKNNIFGTNSVVQGENNIVKLNNSTINGSFYIPQRQINNEILNIGTSPFKSYFDSPTNLEREGMHMSGDSLYIGGQFRKYDGFFVDSILKLDKATGKQDYSFLPYSGWTNTKRSGERGYINTVNTWNDQYVIVGGNFEYGLKIFDLSGNEVLTPNLLFNIGLGSASKDNYIRTSYVEGDFIYLGGVFNGLCNTGGTVNFPRRNMIKVNLTTLSADTWGFDAGFVGAVNDIIEYDSTNLMVVGNFTLYNAATNVRATVLTKSAGTVNTVFDPGTTSFSDIVNCVVKDNNNDFYFGGKFSNYQSNVQFGITKTSNTGVYYSGFTGNVTNYFTSVSLHNVENLILPQSTGDTLFVLGSFKQINGENTNSFGVIDTITGQNFLYSLPKIEFDINNLQNQTTGYDSSRTTEAIIDGNNLYLGGNFKKYNNLDYNSVIRLDFGLNPI
jgi:hypothetical protein